MYALESALFVSPAGSARWMLLSSPQEALAMLGASTTSIVPIERVALIDPSDQVLIPVVIAFGEGREATQSDLTIAWHARWALTSVQWDGRRMMHAAPSDLVRQAGHAASLTFPPHDVGIALLAHADQPMEIALIGDFACALAAMQRMISAELTLQRASPLLALGTQIAATIGHPTHPSQESIQLLEEAARTVLSQIPCSELTIRRNDNGLITVMADGAPLTPAPTASRARSAASR